jgi:hypothetical protein
MALRKPTVIKVLSTTSVIMITDSSNAMAAHFKQANSKQTNKQSNKQNQF